VSVRSQRELLDAAAPAGVTRYVVPDLDVDANELELVYRARGMDADQARARADAVLRRQAVEPQHLGSALDHETVGTAWGAAASSFAFFACGAVVPIVPFLVGLDEAIALVVAMALVSLALLLTGTIVGILSGSSPLRRALRQLAIGTGAAGITYLLGVLVGASLG
jgi:VIT1/CCC1 family predicted Fe2+/Mn2+ transporter